MHTSCRQGAARFLCEWHPDAIKPVHSDVLREMSSKRPEEGWVEARVEEAAVEARIEARIEEKSAVEAGIEKPPPNARSEEAVVEAGIEPHAHPVKVFVCLRRSDVLDRAELGWSRHRGGGP